MTKKKIFKIIGHISVIVLFAFLVFNTDFKEMFYEIRKVRLSAFLLVIALQFLTQYLLVLQWHRISAKVSGNSTIKKMAYIFTKGTVIEAITPGAKIGGEATRLYYLKKECKSSTQKALNIILIQKSISMSVLMLVCVVCLFKLSHHMKGFLPLPLQLIISATFLSVVITMIGSLLFSDKFAKWLALFDNKIAEKLHKYIDSYSSSVAGLGKKEWIIQFMISSIVWVLFPVKMYVLIFSFGVILDFEHTTAVTMTSYMMGMLPITPGGLGTFEGTMLALLSVFSVKKNISIAVTVIFRFVTFWFVIIGSFVFTTVYEIVNRGGKSIAK